MKNIKVVVYDFDGVIADSLPIHYSAIAEVCRRCGVLSLPPLNTMCDWWGAPFEERFRELGVTLKSEELWSLYNGILSGESRLVFPGFAQTAKALKAQGKFLYVVSAGVNRLGIATTLLEQGVSDLFEDIFYGNDDKTEAISIIIKQHNVRPTEVAFVGDMISDVGDAKRSGVIPVGFDGGYGGRSALITAGVKELVTSHEEILALF
jgi:phosphoglycolate phosphatase-like HAD superfamily hydrolase